MTATLAELLQPQTVQQVFQILLGVYQAAGFPVQSWQVGGVERTRLMAIATVVTDLSSGYIPSITSGGFVDLASGDWLSLLSENLYDLTREPATFTVGDITLTAATGSGPYTFTAGSLIAVFAASGNRYINTTGGTLTLSGTLDVEFRAEFAGASYADPSSSGSISLVSPLPGVTLTNVAGDYSDVGHVGSGTGTATPSGTPVGPHSVVVEINSTGAAGVATWSYSLDGAPFTTPSATNPKTNLGGTGITVTLVNGGSGTSFVDGDTYSFVTPGSWITTQGSDAETDAVLQTRCRDRWSSLSSIPTNGFYELLAFSTPDIGSQVTQVVVVLDQVINNKVNIVVAGPEGALPAPVVADIQAYIDARVPITDFPVVVSPDPVTIVLTGTITASANLLASVQDGVLAAVSNYVNSVGINGTVRIAEIIEKVMDIDGVIDITDVEINGVAENFVLGDATTFEIPELETSPAPFDYITV